MTYLVVTWEDEREDANEPYDADDWQNHALWCTFVDNQNHTIWHIPAKHS